MESEAKMREIVELLGELAKKLDVKDPYYTVAMELRSNGTIEYRAYFSFGDRLNNSTFFYSTHGFWDLTNQINNFMRTNDSNALSIMYHEKQIESNKHTIGFHEKTIKALKNIKEKA
jgi:hypothetical protein